MNLAGLANARPRGETPAFSCRPLFLVVLEISSTGEAHTDAWATSSAPLVRETGHQQFTALPPAGMRSGIRARGAATLALHPLAVE